MPISDYSMRLDDQPWQKEPEAEPKPVEKRMKLYIFTAEPGKSSYGNLVAGIIAENRKRAQEMADEWVDQLGITCTAVLNRYFYLAAYYKHERMIILGGHIE